MAISDDVTVDAHLTYLRDSDEGTATLVEPVQPTITSVLPIEGGCPCKRCP